jgi:hypothetical protein
MRPWICFCFFALIFPSVGPAETSKDLIEILPTGTINWTTGVLEAKGLCPVIYTTAQDADARPTLEQARRMAAENVLQSLKQMRIDSNRYVETIMAANPEILARIRFMAESAQVIQENRLAGEILEVTIRIDILGGLAQILLPEDIKQVESIKPIPSASVLKVSSASVEDSGHSGLIVDARGIGAKPTLVPLLVDESGKEIFGSAFVSREYAVQYGVSGYMRSLDGPNRQMRVGTRPLTVKGLRTLQEGTCDIVISNADAARLRNASSNLGFLRQCKVMIVLD